eukprot:TRINITY_DN44214_c0_g1_i4.p3 TRINITY_DN44214_c0_g1~~TRINITY_DN44214_c0_g1_i4.p3  ORF type:complete len:112 (-),score=11.53 TRINITY_DN44214_c0_g1_i4:522-857(-)
MLNWGLLPQAATSTAIFMVMFTSSSTILQFALLGRVSFAVSVGFWLTGFAGGLLGSKVVADLMKTYGRQWMITVGLGLLIIASGSGMAVAVSLQSLGQANPAHSEGIQCGT